MSSKKEPDFMDLDFWQKHNRNVQLKRSADAAEEAARAKKEMARQVRLAREADEQHRAELREIARQEKEANDRHRAEMKEIARQEKEAKEFTKQQQFKLYDISCRVEELGNMDAISSRIRSFFELKMEFEYIVHDAIMDLRYRKLYTKVQASLKNEENLLSSNYAEEYSFYQSFFFLKNQVESYANTKEIRSFEEKHYAEALISNAHYYSATIPDLYLDTTFLQELILSFQERIAKIKWWCLYLDANNIAPTEERYTLLLSYYKLNKSSISGEEWDQITSVAFSVDDVWPFCNHCMVFARNQNYTKTALDILGAIDAPETRRTIKTIKEEQKKMRNPAEGFGGCVSVIIIVIGVFFLMCAIGVLM